MYGVSVFENGSMVNGKIVAIQPLSIWQDVVSAIENEFKDAKIIYNWSGQKVTTLEQMLRDGQIFFVSRGEEFIPYRVTLPRRSEDVSNFNTEHQKEIKSSNFSTAIRANEDQLIEVMSRTEDRVSPAHKTRTLPVEVLEVILYQLPTRDLIKFRQVNALWKQICSFICRKRFVKLKNWWETDSRKPDNIFTLFDTNSLPWSSYIFATNRNINNEIKERREIFLQIFGPYLHKVIIERLSPRSAVSGGNWNPVTLLHNTPNIVNLEVTLDIDISNAFKVLRFATNLRKLKIHMDQNRGYALPFSVHPQPGFSKLQKVSLGLSSGKQGAFILQYLLKSGAPLIYVKAYIKAFGREDPEGIRRLISVTSGILYLDIRLFGHVSCPDIHSILASAKNLRIIKTLNLDLNEPIAENLIPQNYFHPAEQLLCNCKRLRSLTIKCWILKGHSRIPFQFLDLPELKSLEIEFHPSAHAIWEDSAFVNVLFSRLQTNYFPALEKVSIDTKFERGSKLNKWPKFSMFSLCHPTHFDSVTELSVCKGIQDNWSHFFPNLRKLVIQVCDDLQVLQNVFCNERLEELELFLHFDENHGNQVNDLIFGSRIYAEKVDVEVVASRNAVQDHPTLVSLKCLRKLKLCVKYWEYTVRLRDTGEQHALLKIQPLQHLQLDGWLEVSDEFQTKLRARHEHVEADVVMRFRQYPSTSKSKFS